MRFVDVRFAEEGSAPTGQRTFSRICTRPNDNGQPVTAGQSYGQESTSGIRNQRRQAAANNAQPPLPVVNNLENQSYGQETTSGIGNYGRHPTTNEAHPLLGTVNNSSVHSAGQSYGQESTSTHRNRRMEKHQKAAANDAQPPLPAVNNSAYQSYGQETTTPSSLVDTLVWWRILHWFRVSIMVRRGGPMPMKLYINFHVFTTAWLRCLSRCILCYDIQCKVKLHLS